MDKVIGLYLEQVAEGDAVADSLRLDHLATWVIAGAPRRVIAVDYMSMVDSGQCSWSITHDDGQVQDGFSGTLRDLKKHLLALAG